MPRAVTYHPLTLCLVVCVLILGVWALPLRADEDPAAPPLAADDQVPLEDERPQLHKVYVPFRDLAKIFEKEGEGVFLPYEEFLSLWRRAHAEERKADEPPVRATVRSAAYEGKADGDLVVLESRLEVDVLADGWQRVPLDFAGAGIERATIDGRPALLVPAEHGYHLLLKDKGLRTLELALRIGTVRDGDRRTAEFRLPSVPLSRLTLDVPGTATDVDVAPRLASTTQPQDDGTTRLLAFLGPVDRIRLSWRQRTEAEPQLAPLVFVDELHDVRIDQGVLRSEMTASLSVLRAPLRRLALAIPPDAVTLYVQGDGIRTWTRSEDGALIRVELREPVRERWELRLGLERPLPVLPSTVTLPLAAVEGVERETGFVRLLAGEGVKVEASDTPGLMQVDLTELPESLRGAPAGRAVAYRFPARPGTATVDVEALEPRVSVALGARIVIRPEGTEVRTAAAVTVERAGVFGVELDLPATLEVTAVRVRGIEYDDHKIREEGDARVLQIDFRDRLLGQARVEIDGRMATPLPPEDDTSRAEESLSVPLLQFRGAAHVRGYVAIHVAAALEHREVSKAGLTPMDAGAPAALEPPGVPGPAAPLAHRFEHHEGDVDLVLALRRRDPAVTAAVETTVKLEPDRMRVGSTLRYHVRYRGVDTMRFTAPAALQDRLHLDLEGAQLLGPEPIEGEEGDGARGLWTVKLPSPRTGSVPIPLEIEDLPESALASGESRLVQLPTFVPIEKGTTALPNTVYHVAVRRDPLLEVVPENLDRAEEIDARELPPALRSEDNFLAFRAYDPSHSIRVAVTRHDYEPVAAIVVSHLHLDTVVHEGTATTEAYLVVQNNDQQYLKLRLPPEASIRAVTVEGKTRTPRKGDEGSGIVLIPLLSGLGKDESFVVALAYDHDVSRSGTLFETTTITTPEPLDVTADLLTWRVYAPLDRSYTSFGGTVEPARPYRSWFAKLVNRLSRTLGRKSPKGRADVARLAGGFRSPFATRHEGRVFLFSNRVGTGSVEITGASRSAFLFWKLLWFAVILFGAVALAPVAARVGIGEGTFFAALVSILLVLLVRASPGTAQVLNAMIYGVFAAGLLRLLLHAGQARRARLAGAASASEDAPTDEGDGHSTSPSDPKPGFEGGAA